MAYYPHTLVQIVGGYVPAALSAERWSIGVRVGVGGPGGDYVDTNAAYAADIQTPIATWFSAAGNFMSNQAKLLSIKVNDILPDGTYRFPYTTQVDYTTPPVGGVASTWPIYCTVAVSWTTAVARGRAHTGRIYPPFAGLALTDPGHLNSSARTACLNAGKALLTILNRLDSSGTLVSPSVYSKLGGEAHSITGVRVGDVPDVQRRRKEQLVESYASSVWP